MIIRPVKFEITNLSDTQIDHILSGLVKVLNEMNENPYSNTNQENSGIKEVEQMISKIQRLRKSYLNSLIESKEA